MLIHLQGNETTVRAALALHVRGMRAKCCTTRSVRAFQEDIEKHLGDWLARPLVSLSPHDVVTRHQFLIDTAGSYPANRVFYQLRALYGTVLQEGKLQEGKLQEGKLQEGKLHEGKLQEGKLQEGMLQVGADVPRDLPAFSVACTSANRRREPIPWRALPVWRTNVEALRNPVRRDLHLFLLYSGLRCGDARSLRWADVDFETCTLNPLCPRPALPRAFTVPLTSELLLVLLRRRKDNQAFLGQDDGGWVFPTRRRSGAITHVQEANQKRVLDGKHVRSLPAPYRLRDTFIRAAHEIGVDPMCLRLLLNDTMVVQESSPILPQIESLQAAAESIVELLNQRQAVPC